MRPDAFTRPAAGAIQRRPGVLLLGGFDATDPAADALCAVCCAALHEYDVLVSSRTPEETSRRHGVRSTGVGTAAVAAAMGSTDVVIVGGGTVFASGRTDTSGEPSTLLRSLFVQLRLAKARHLPFALLGVGAGDLSGDTARRMSRWIIRHADLLVLRDEESAEVLEAAGAPGPFWVGSDLAWNLAGSARPAAAGVLRPAITLVPSAGTGAAAAAPALAEALRDLGGEYQLRLQSWLPVPAPLLSTDPLRDLLEGDVVAVAPPRNLTDAIGGYAGNELVVAAPIPAQVAAGLAGTRLLALVDGPGSGSVARRLGQSTVPAGAGAETISAAIRAALAGPLPADSAVAAEAALAERTLAFARLFVDRGVGDHVIDLQPVGMTMAGAFR